MNLNELVVKSFEKIQGEGLVEKLVEEKLANTIGSIIDDLLSYYGNFGKKLREEIEKRIAINFDELNIETYTHVLAQTLQTEMDKAIYIQGVDKMKQALDEILKNPKDQYKLSELIEMMKKQDVLHGDNVPDQISFHIAENRSVLTHIYFDPEPRKERYECKYRMWIDKENTLRGCEIRGKQPDQRFVMGDLYGFEAELFRIYAHGSKIIIDEDDVNVEYYCDDDY